MIYPFAAPFIFLHLSDIKYQISKKRNTNAVFLFRITFNLSAYPFGNYSTTVAGAVVTAGVSAGVAADVATDVAGADVVPAGTVVETYDGS